MASAHEPYPPPLDQLLTLGEDAARAPEWPDYLSLGVGPEHVPRLIDMVTDRRLRDADDPAGWAPLHAWRTLGQLRAADAAAPLTSLLHEMEEWDWVNEELPRVFAMIGPPAIEVLTRYLDRRDRGLYPRVGAAAALTEVAKANPTARDACVAALTEQLRRFATQDRTLNGFLVGNLLDLHAVDVAPMMEQTFAAGRVDISIAGDWEDAQVELGLLPARLSPRPHYHAAEVLLVDAPSTPHPSRERRAARRAEKRRRKLAKASKRRNRRK